MSRELLTPLSIPLSILIGSAIIGAGLYFGLRERSEVAPPARPAVPTAAPEIALSIVAPPSPTPPGR